MFIETLSAPAPSTCLISSMQEMPPPTMNGMKTSFETLLASSIALLLFSAEADMSRKASSSAPSL